MKVRRLNWQLTSRLGSVLVKIRSRTSKTEAEIVSQDQHELVVRFKTPQKAVTPGQAAVFYDKDRVIGGGWIHSAVVSLTTSCEPIAAV